MNEIIQLSMGRRREQSIVSATIASLSCEALWKLYWISIVTASPEESGQHANRPPSSPTRLSTFALGQKRSQKRASQGMSSTSRKILAFSSALCGSCAMGLLSLWTRDAER
jgi:hypothetical protein